MVSRPASSGLSSASRMSLVGSTPPKDADQQYLNEGFLKSNSSWDERSHPDSTTPFQTNKAAEGSVSKSSSQRTTTSKMAASSATRSEEKEIWASPSWSPARNSSAVGEKASQTSLHHYCPQSSGDDHFRASPLVKANLVEVTVINNPPPNDMVAGSSKCALQGAEGGVEKLQNSKHGEATSKTIDSGVQMVTGDGDSSPTKKSKKKKIKLIPRFLRVKKKK